MKFAITFFLAVTLIDGCLSAALQYFTTSNNNLQPANAKIVNIYPGSRLEVMWERIEYDDENNPLLGYKVELSVAGMEQYIFYFNKVDSLVRLVPRNKTANMNTEKIPYTVTVDLVSQKFIKVVVTNLKMHVQYSVRIQAFYDNGDGPYSSPAGVKIGG